MFTIFIGDNRDDKTSPSWQRRMTAPQGQMSLTHEDDIVDTILVLFICISSVYIVFVVFVVAFVMHSIPLAVSLYPSFIIQTLSY